MAKHKFPHQVYVQHCGDCSEPFLQCSAKDEDACDAEGAASDAIDGAGQRVAIYELKRIVKLKKTVIVDVVADLSN